MPPAPVDRSGETEEDDTRSDNDENADNPNNDRDDDERLRQAFPSQLDLPRPDAFSAATALRNHDGSFASGTGWDLLLQRIQLASRAMRENRRWKMRGLKSAAGWCKWQHKQCVAVDGEFITDLEGGYRLKRTLKDNEDTGGNETSIGNGTRTRTGEGSRVWNINLGYRREGDVAGEDAMDWSNGDIDTDTTGIE
ncbi:hypothetical protein A1O1_08567 [Capronia coronata CBS 617.96]|uniref:Uncharacterized protein n=1 Tax=Capronia coronata CBS 617.96 TaxID=1182541 RepID=W9XIU9_9EURO|nr:uncharacterized protein A1O1_08567 [Capronia coronata CBS 617.96]EXJ80422.1 hypothetical protein A1O1_08567 [Capronia coronata CBS 617.96]